MVEHHDTVCAVTREHSRVARERRRKTHRDKRAAKAGHQPIAVREQFETATRDLALEVGLADHPQIASARRLAYRAADRLARLAVAPERDHRLERGDYFARRSLRVGGIDH